MGTGVGPTLGGGARPPRPTHGGGTCSTTLYEYDGPIVELKRVNRSATWRLSEKILEGLLRFVCFSDLRLQRVGQDIQ